jgi:hypothetical protein
LNILPEISPITPKVSAVLADVSTVFPYVSLVVAQIAAVFPHLSFIFIAVLRQGRLLYCYESECQTGKRNPVSSFHRCLLIWKWVQSTL